MECFVKVVSGYSKNSILDVWQGSEYASLWSMVCNFPIQSVLGKSILCMSESHLNLNVLKPF